jgi:cell division protein FtsB
MNMDDIVYRLRQEIEQLESEIVAWKQSNALKTVEIKRLQEELAKLSRAMLNRKIRDEV